MDALMKEINAKLQLLALTEAKTKGIMEGGNMETIQRHLDALKGISKGVDDLKLQIEQAKITKGETPEEVIAWSGEIGLNLPVSIKALLGLANVSPSSRQRQIWRVKKSKRLPCKRRGRSS